MNEIYAQHLQGMVRIPTVSNPDASKMDYTQFDRLHAYLEETYPLVHKTMARTIIGRASLLFHWKCENPAKPPILLMGHQDVVPEGDHAKWKYPPFSGEIAEGCVWGRGSGDCKSLVLAEMETLEALIASGFKPDFDIYLAFGENEEVHAVDKGAEMTVEYLKSQSVRLGAVFDEGGSINVNPDGGYICAIHLGEKASQDFEIYQECAGGHSMAPGAGTALGAVAKAVVAIEANPFPYRLTEIVRAQLKAQSKGMSGKKAEIYADPDGHWDELTALAHEDKKLDALLHTTCAVTMAYGSAQSNILPEKAGVIMNCRVLEGDTTESMLARFRTLIPSDVQIRLVAGKDPGPSTPTSGRAYKLVEEIMRDLYGENILVVPGLLGGGTDSRYFPPICDNVFRFSGYVKDESKWGQAHKVNEKVPLDALDSSIRFFTELLKRY